MCSKKVEQILSCLSSKLEIPETNNWHFSMSACFGFELAL